MTITQLEAEANKHTAMNKLRHILMQTVLNLDNCSSELNNTCNMFNEFMDTKKEYNIPDEDTTDILLELCNLVLKMKTMSNNIENKISKEF